MYMSIFIYIYRYIFLRRGARLLMSSHNLMYTPDVPRTISWTNPY